MGGLFGGSNSNNSGGGQFNSGPVATVGANDFGSFGSQGSSVFDQSPSGVVGDPFFDPVFGSQLLSGQSGQQGFTPATGIGEPAQYTREPQTTATDTAATSQQQQQRQPLVEASTGLQQVAKLLRGNQQPQGPGWIQPQQQQAPQIPPQVANAMARDQSGGPPQPQLPQLPETPAAQPVPLPRRRPDDAPQDGSVPAAAVAAGGGGPDPVDAAARTVAAQATPAAAPQAAGSFPSPTISLLQWLSRLLSSSGGQFLSGSSISPNLQRISNQARQPQPSVLPQATAAVPGAASGAAPPNPPAAGATPALQWTGRGPPPSWLPVAGPTGTPAATAAFNPQNYTSATWQIESNNNPGAQTGNNRGLGQFGPAEERMYGINDSNRHLPEAQARALHREYQHHLPILRQALGREPQPWESYFMHQQGIGGGPALLRAHPGAPAWRVLTQFYSSAKAKRAIEDNTLADHPLKRVPVEERTVEQFRQMWRDRFNREYNKDQSMAPVDKTGENSAQVAQGRRFQTRPGRNALLDWLDQQGAA